MTEDPAGHTDEGWPRALSAVPVVTAWLLAVGVDLLFNAGLFSSLFEQSREPGLLDDETLFRRIPVAYLALLLGVAGLAWLLDRTGRRGSGQGLALGVAGGLVAAALGVISLWTAVKMTGGFVAAAVLVQATQFAAAGAVLGAYRVAGTQRRVTQWTLAMVVLLVLAAVLAQNTVGAVN